MAKIEMFRPQKSSIETRIDPYGNLFIITWQIVPEANILADSVCGTAFPFPGEVA